MLVNVSKEEGIKFRKHIYKIENDEFKEDDYGYYNEDNVPNFNFHKNCRLLGWKDGNELKAIVSIIPFMDRTEYKFLRGLIKETIISTYYYYKDESYCNLLLKEISKLYPSIILFQGEYLEYDTYEGAYTEIDVLSPYGVEDENEDGIKEKIIFNFTYLFSVNLKIDLNKLFKSYYNFNKKSINKEKFSYKVLDAEALRIILYDSEGTSKIPLAEKYGKLNYMGFHYFSPGNLSSFGGPEGLKFITCFYEKNLIGVLKVANYSLGEDKNYVGLNYIDVHKDYRRFGVSRGLYKVLNSIYPPDTILISSDLSDIGKQANINLVRKSIVNNFLTFDNKIDYFNYQNLPNKFCDSINDSDNRRMLRLKNLLINKNNKFKILEINTGGKYLFKFICEDGYSFYFSPSVIYDCKKNKYVYKRQNNNSTLKPLLMFINGTKNNKLSSVMNELLPYIIKAFNLKNTVHNNYGKVV